MLLYVFILRINFGISSTIDDNQSIPKIGCRAKYARTETWDT